jgi:anti-anti-sigma factor
MNFSVGGGISMKIQISELEHGLRLITLNGQLDGNGVYAVEVDFIRNCVEGGHHVLVDISKVSYISSIGMPMLIHTAKLVRERGGKLALLNPQHRVEEVLDMVGISHIIPIFYDLKAARAGMAD